MTEFKGDKRTKEYRSWKAKHEKQSKGLGDTIEKFTTATGIKKFVDWVTEEDCGCSERRDALNKIFPYKQPKWFTEEEYSYLTEWFSRKRNSISVEDQKRMFAIHNRILDEKEVITGGCTPCKFNRIQDRVKQVYDKYQ